MRLLAAVAPLLDADISLRVYGTPALAEVYDRLFAALGDRHRLVVAPEPRSKPGRVAVENTWLARVSADDDVVHHAGGTVPHRTGAPAIVTIHDLQPLELPQHFGTVKRLWLGRALPRAVKTARLVLCPSNFTARQLADLLAVAPDRIRVIPHGHDPGGDQEHEPGDRTDGPTHQVDIDPSRFGRYLLYPAIAYPHKRHRDVVEVLQRLGPANDDVRAVFTGRLGPEHEAVTDLATRLGVADRVHWLGRVPRADLDALYRSAVGLVFPSAYEGFGNPALEAMAAGVPVVASDAGALPEVVGQAGLICPVGDIGALTKAVEQILTDRDLVDELTAAGTARARHFGAGIAAQSLAEVYGEVADWSNQ